MTSDAKIGLLLGLVFIFIIAFIINGLPNLKPQSSKADVTTSAPDVSGSTLGLVDNEQNAQEVLNWEELMDRQGSEAEPFEPVVAESGSGETEAEPSIDESATTVVAEGGDEDVRSVLPLPSAETVERVTRGISDIIRGLADTPRPAAAQETTTEPAPAIETPEPTPQPQRVERARASAPSDADASSRPLLRLPKVYEVVEGDNLASVAKKVYGPEEGNKRANIQRLFEANRNVLDAPDQIYVGQKLVVPPLPPSPKKVLPKALFKEVESIGAEQLADMGTKPSEGRYYVVQEGDNLWKIASTQLGSGARYEEIRKLNEDVLKGKEVLDIGMRLRLPSK